MKVEFEIEDHDIVAILRGDTSFGVLLRDKILGMDDLPDMSAALVEAAKAEVVKHLKAQVLSNLFEVRIGTYGEQWTVLKEHARSEISDIAKTHMYDTVRSIIMERDKHTQQTVQQKLAEYEKNLDFEKIMVQAAKELLKESMQAAQAK